MRKLNRKNQTAQGKSETWKLSEDPFLLDDPGGTPLEWLEPDARFLRPPVRLNASKDPWLSSDHAAEDDALTERRRRKLQALSMTEEECVCNERGESVA